MRNPLVSVIISTKNSARTIGHCLATIKKQSYKPIEIIIVDNKSTDNTKDIAKKYTKKVYDYGPERSAQRNFGARKSKGRYLLIHDSDIYFHKDTVADCVSLVQKYDFDQVIIPEKSIGEGFWTKVRAFERSFYVNNPKIESARFFKREVYFKFGGYDEEITGFEDRILSVSIINAGLRSGSARNILLHDEGRISFIDNFKKKMYYARSLRKYKKKYPKIAKEQLNLARFDLISLMKEGVLHPVLFLGMVILKSSEALSPLLVFKKIKSVKIF